MSARILVVDDIAPNVKLLEAKLSAEYFEVLTARDGPSALQIAKSQSPDLILLDVMMPGMDGFEVCRHLKEHDESKNIPVIFVTAMDDQVNEEQGFKLGAVDYITKPVRPPVVKARVQLHLRLALHQRLLELIVERAGSDLVLTPAARKVLTQLQSL